MENIYTNIILHLNFLQYIYTRTWLHMYDYTQEWDGKKGKNM